MHGHVRMLGTLYILYHGFSLIVLMFVAIGVGMLGMFSGDLEAFAVTTLVACGLGLLALITVLPGLIAGWGLLDCKPWARILAIIVALFNVWSIPFGTALSIYAMYVLFSGKSDSVFNRRYEYYYG